MISGTSQTSLANDRSVSWIFMEKWEKRLESVLMRSRLANQPMIYKDLTQWLHTGIFVALYFSLIVIDTLLSLFAALGHGGVNQADHFAGLNLLGNLKIVLASYLLAVAAASGLRTAEELRSGVFDLFVLTGIRQEQIIGGKFTSMMIQFLFGLFCIGPYMFFTYLLGGVDFYQILGAITLFCILAPPLFISTLSHAFRKKKDRDFISAAARIGCMFFIFMFIIPFFIMMMSMMLKESALKGEFGFSTLIKGVFMLDVPIIVTDTILLGVYALILMYQSAFCTNRLLESVPALRSAWGYYRRRTPLPAEPETAPSPIDMPAPIICPRLGPMPQQAKERGCEPQP